MVSRRFLIVALIGVCVLSAAIGSGITLLSKTGPAGPVGARGEPGPVGPRGFAATDEAGENAEGQVVNLQGEVEELQGEVERDEGLIEELGGQVTQNTQSVSTLCIELNAGC